MLAISYHLPSISFTPLECSSSQTNLTSLRLGLGLGFLKGNFLPEIIIFSNFKKRPKRHNLKLQLHRILGTGASGGAIRAVGGRNGERLSPWDEKPYVSLAGGRKGYLDEQDVVTLLDPPKELVPLDPASYNPAAYLWKKIEDIPEERRHRLLNLLQPRLMTRVWEMAGTRYGDPKLVKKSASNLLSTRENSLSLEFWSCRTSGGPLPIAWINGFNKVVFSGKDGNLYGRIFLGGSILSKIANSMSPLYFQVSQLKEVMSTEQPCDLAYEFGEGLLYLDDHPEGFPKPVRHPWPFNDHVVVYVRHAGPGVMVGQAWQEGKELQQVPKKFCGEILMVKNYGA